MASKRNMRLSKSLIKTQNQRHTQFAMILLIGSTGCGKSSTINHLLDIGDGIGNKKSSSRKTSEYIFTFDEPKYEVRDLAMSVFSSPGFNNSDSIEQNACNFLSIKEYFKTHPKLKAKKINPNMVFLFGKVGDDINF